MRDLDITDKDGIPHAGSPQHEGQSTLSTEFGDDPRWKVIERISESETFKRSHRLPSLLRYLASCTIRGDREGLTEYEIGKAVLEKQSDYSTAEDSSVRVYVRQLRLRLYEYHQTQATNEPFLVLLPKGGYALTFEPNQQLPIKLPAQPSKIGLDDSRKLRRLKFVSLFLLAIALICATGWIVSVTGRHPAVPWPLNEVIHSDRRTPIVLGDATYPLRLMDPEPVTLDSYADHSFYKALRVEGVSRGEAHVIHYLIGARITSVADAHAAAMFASTAGSYFFNLDIRTAKEFNANDLAHGDIVLIGAKTSNPWAEMFDDRLNFVFVEDSDDRTRYIANKKPLKGESQRYLIQNTTGASGQDFATVSLLPRMDGSGKVLLIQGIRMEGTEAAIDLLKNEHERSKLFAQLRQTCSRCTPKYFEVLLRAQSVVGSPMSLDLLATRAW